nr:ubiquitin carboxyl-terminal hydrolase 20-like [Tanacetum cinerariifolium]
MSSFHSSLINLKVKDDALPSESDNLVKQVFGAEVLQLSDTYEPSVDLSLEIDSLSTALESFTKVECIEDEEMKFTCDQGKEKVSQQAAYAGSDPSHMCFSFEKNLKTMALGWRN